MRDLHLDNQLTPLQGAHKIGPESCYPFFRSHGRELRETRVQHPPSVGSYAGDVQPAGLVYHGLGITVCLSFDPTRAIRVCLVSKGPLSHQSLTSNKAALALPTSAIARYSPLDLIDPALCAILTARYNNTRLMTGASNQLTKRVEAAGHIATIISLSLSGARRKQAPHANIHAVRSTEETRRQPPFIHRAPDEME